MTSKSYTYYRSQIDPGKGQFSFIEDKFISLVIRLVFYSFDICLFTFHFLQVYSYQSILKGHYSFTCSQPLLLWVSHLVYCTSVQVQFDCVHFYIYLVFVVQLYCHFKHKCLLSLGVDAIGQIWHDFSEFLIFDPRLLRSPTSFVLFGASMISFMQRV